MHPEVEPVPARDQFGRPLTDLRVSVTDRCNFRCRYCMPREHFGAEHQHLPREELLTFEEITRVVHALVPLGLTKVRLTGGEPLLRRELPVLVRRLVDEGVEVALTTNGVLLPSLAGALAAAGLGRLTVSLDALEEEMFRRLTDANYAPEDVLAGLRAAEAAGFSACKVNCVVVRGHNEAAITALAERFRGTPHVVRYIEYMDVGHTNGWAPADVVPRDEILAILATLGAFEQVPRARVGEPAERYRWRDGSGEFGVIASVTAPFCGNCSRARLTARGELFTCLFGAARADLRELLRPAGDDAELRALLFAIWAGRTERYSEERHATGGDALVQLRLGAGARPEMSYLGG